MEALVAEAVALEESELEVRARVGAAIGAGRAGRADADQRLLDAAQAAESAGLTELAGQCWSERADLSLELAERARSARAAFGLRPDQVGIYAMYSVAVDAHNAESFALSAALCEEIMSVAGDLTDPVRAVLESARSSLP
jgi:hypothetical protein